jgi:GNAT superfamily N-acetyltransferase
MSTLVIEDVAFDSALAEALVAEVQQEYVTRYGGPDRTPVDPLQFASPYGAFFVATVDGEPIGCGGLRRHDDGVVEIKRMFVRSAHRRRGHARSLLRALEDRARASGYRRVVLETGLAQPEAIALYTGEGYQPTDGFGHYKDSPISRSFVKDLFGGGVSPT